MESVEARSLSVCQQVGTPTSTIRLKNDNLNIKKVIWGFSVCGLSCWSFLDRVHLVLFCLDRSRKILMVMMNNSYSLCCLASSHFANSILNFPQLLAGEYSIQWSPHGDARTMVILQNFNYCKEEFKTSINKK